MSAINQTTPAVLKNRGVPVAFHVLERDEESRWVRSYTGDTPVTEVVHLQMTNDVLASIEDDDIGWGSLDAWQADLAKRPFMALGRTIAICRDWYTAADKPDSRRAGKAMVDAEIDSYSAAVGGAFMLANGMAPERVGETLAAGVKASAAQKKQAMDKVSAQLEQELAEQEAAPDSDDATPTPQPASTRGRGGSKRGASSAARSTSSGD